jgi:hypothetical protein
MPSEIDYAGIGVNVLLRVREDDERLPEIVESFSDGKIVGLANDAAHVVVGLRIDAVSWPAVISYVESRLDRLDFDWRQHASCTRP